MRVLLDNNIDRRFTGHLTGHEAVHARRGVREEKTFVEATGSRSPYHDKAILNSSPKGVEYIMNINREILGGEPCFNGTRVPLETVIDNVAHGVSVERILRNYLSLIPEHIDAVLKWELDLA